ncbi:MAG TPA: peptidoglycan-associated lipoprotein Pal [Vicinamibacterales bacterium]|nr:peptidoglycan-associated lipoprotein Pal [Vicinamibacterales bacterium]
MRRLIRSSLFFVLLAATVAACGGKKAPVVNPPPAPAFPGAIDSSGGTTTSRPPDPPPVPRDSFGAAPLGDAMANRSIEDINRDSPLKPVFFLYDSDELDDAAKQVLAANAEVLKTYRTWVVTIEGHSDERGTAEYNLALGDRRALAARSYLMTLGIAADRLRTVSYGEEFPFDPGHDESAWSKNRRAHFMLTSK